MITMKRFPAMILGLLLAFGCQKNDLKDTGREKAILFFTVEGQLGKTAITREVDSSLVRLLMPSGTNLTAIKPVITVSDGATISPTSGEAVNFSTGRQTYVVTSADGSTRNWLVDIAVQDNTYDSLVFIPNTGQWSDRVMVFHDTLYNSYLTRYSGWNGGDGCVTTLLPNGNLLWSFQDSFFGEVTPERARIDNVFVRNAGFIQQGNSTKTYVQLNPIGSDGKATTWVLVPGAADGDKDLYWGGPAQVVGADLQMVMGHMHLNATTNQLEHLGTDVVIFNAADMQQKQVIRNKYVGAIGFDGGLFKANDGYTYMYAAEYFGICGSNLYAARVANNDITGDWEFFTKTGWSKANPATADLQPILTADATQPNVFEKNGKYYLVSQTTCFGLSIKLWEGPSPTGPFTNERVIYRIPEKYNGTEILTYNAVVHHALSRHGELVVSYNINPLDFWSNFNVPGSADRYRPWVVRVFNWE
jgi:hypothetical protein